MSHDSRQAQSLRQAPAASRRRPVAPPPPPTNRPLALPPAGAHLLLVRGQGQASQPHEDGPRSDVLRRVPSWLLSAAVHLLVLIGFGLLYMAHAPNTSQEIEVDPIWGEQLGDPLSQDLLTHDSPLAEGKVLAISPAPLANDPFSAPSQTDIGPAPGILGGGNAKAPAIGNNPFGRDIGSRQANLKKGGGNETTETAVRNALLWLKKQQRSDGSWSLSGPFESGVRTEEPVGATAMALLAFQGAGHTHQEGEFKEQVRKGKEYLLARQAKGTWPTDSGHHSMYVHAQCTIVLCELYAMTQDSALRGPAEQAVKVCLDRQSKWGGWRYDPAAQDADLSVTGWVVMALQSAKIAKLEVPQQTFDRISKFLDDCSPNGGSRYGYLPQDGEIRVSMTAEALMCREWLGWPRDNKHLQSGIKYLVQAENLPRWEVWDDLKNRGRDVYYWYYATQAIHHYGGPEWYRWNNAILATLPNAQIKGGPEAGSWDYRGDKWGRFGGRLYVTCLSTYILEVYYRHLPIYKSRE